MTGNWSPLVFEFAIVVAFAIGWMILEWQGRRLDRQRDERKADPTNEASDETPPGN